MQKNPVHTILNWVSHGNRILSHCVKQKFTNYTKHIKNKTGQKDRDVFHFLKNGFSLCCLQDVDFNDKMEAWVRSECSLDCYFSWYASNSRGVTFLFNNWSDAADCVIPCPFSLFKSSLGLCKVWPVARHPKSKISNKKGFDRWSWDELTWK